MNILLVDDQKFALKSLTNLIYDAVPSATIFEAYDGAPAIKMLPDTKPDVVFLDVIMPMMNGLQVAEYLNKNYPNIKIIMFTNVNGRAMVLSLVKMVHGFLSKNVDGYELGACINAVMRGEHYFCKRTTDIIHKSINEMDNLANVHFDKREALLVELLAGGKTTRVMAEMLGMKEKQVNRLREGLLRKTKTKNTTELVAFAFRNGLIWPD